MEIILLQEYLCLNLCVLSFDSTHEVPTVLRKKWLPCNQSGAIWHRIVASLLMYRAETSSGANLYYCVLNLHPPELV